MPSWDIGPWGGPPDPVIPGCEDCGVSLEDGDDTVHRMWCSYALFSFRDPDSANYNYGGG